MEEQTVKTPREIGREIAAYFKDNRITHEEAAMRLGFPANRLYPTSLLERDSGVQQQQSMLPPTVSTSYSC